MPEHADYVAPDGGEWSGLSCPYFARFYGLEGHDPEAVCAFGCYDEPACVTCEPTGGWAGSANA